MTRLNREWWKGEADAIGYGIAAAIIIFGILAGLMVVR